MEAKKNGIEKMMTAGEMITISQRASEEAKALMSANYDTVENSFRMWQNYQHAYFELAANALDQTFQQSLAFRARLNDILEENLHRSYMMMERERGLTHQMVGMFQAQMRSNVEYTTEVLGTFSKMWTTTTLFADWASERMTKMYTAPIIGQ